jgi:nucleotide-binding universal stress UspA family protein
VVVGLDGSPLAEQGLAVAGGLASALDNRLWLVQAVSSTAVAQVARLREQGEQVSASGYLRATAERVAGGAWDTLGQHLTGHDVGIPDAPDNRPPESETGPDTGGPGWEVVQSDDPAAALSHFAHERRASALVLSTHGRSGLRADVLGSTCLAVVAQATVPVLVFVPDAPDQAALPA